MEFTLNKQEYTANNNNIGLVNTYTVDNWIAINIKNTYKKLNFLIGNAL